MTEPTLVPLAKIRPSRFQKRQTINPDAVRERASSIYTNGLNQIPTARMIDGGAFELTFGHRRFEAYKVLDAEYSNQYGEMPLFVDELTDLQMIERGIAENIDCRNLNDIEKAEAMRSYMEGFGKSSAEAAAFFHCSPESVRGTVRLLNLPEEAKNAVRQGMVNVTAARTLLTLQSIAGEAAVVEAVGDMGTGIYDTPAEAIEAQFQAKAVASILPRAGPIPAGSRPGTCLH
jgi:ParB family transcriptional regulator, chromosome partitioning protein